MDKLITITNKLQDAFTVMGTEPPIDLPTIAVVGSQSAGKSSVLETIVGTSFLPRGSGIVTRRPCIINLNNTPPGTAEYGTFLHSGDKKFTMEQICVEIDADTARVCGNNKGLDPRPINLRIFSPNVVNLTLIDLPGATRVAVGDQPADIGQQIQDMLLSYITKPNCIILAVSAANTDLANSDAILLSRQVDPKGERTLGVLTKLDLMDRGTDARGVFTGDSNDVPKLKLGYIGVVNRSQADIQEKKSIKEARNAEMSFFRQHPAYRSLVDQLGTQHLVEKCSQLLINSIIQSLPVISQELSQLIIEKREQLDALPKYDPENLKLTLIEMLVEFVDMFKHLIDGKATGSIAMNHNMVPEDGEGLIGGSRIEAIFRTVFQDDINNIDLNLMAEEEVQALLYNIKGLGGGLFTPDEVLHMMIRRQVEQIESPSLKCCQLVYNELLSIVQQAVSRVPRLQGFPNCVTAMQALVSRIISERFEQTQEQIKLMTKMELFRMNFSHPDFVGRRGIAALLTEEQAADELTQVQLKVTLGDGLEGPAEADGYAAASMRMSSHRSARVGGGGMADLQRAFALMKKKDAGTLSPAEEKELAILEGKAGGGDSRASPARNARPQSSRYFVAPNKISADVDEKLSAVLSGLSENERVEIDMLLRLTQNYFDIVKTNHLDMVPKAISLLLIGNSVEKISTEIIYELLENHDINDLCSITEATGAKREELTQGVALLEEAQDVLLNDVAKAANFGIGS